MTPGGTLDTEQETVSKVFQEHRSKSDKLRNISGTNDDLLYQFRGQNKVLCDMKHETAGLNRKKNENLRDYLERLYQHDLMEHSNDFSIAEFPPERMEAFNQKFKTQDSTYYFSYTTG